MKRKTVETRTGPIPVPTGMRLPVAHCPVAHWPGTYRPALTGEYTQTACTQLHAEPPGRTWHLPLTTGNYPAQTEQPYATAVHLSSSRNNLSLLSRIPSMILYLIILAALLWISAAVPVWADGSGGNAGESAGEDAVESAAESTGEDRVHISRSEVTSYVAVSDDFNPDRKFAQVLKAEARRASDGSWTVSVRLDHNDEILADGSEHYADRWQVVDPRDGSVISERVLWHHHINEMPFTRSQSGIEIDSKLSYVIIRAACTHHGFEGRQVKLFLPGSGS